MATETVEARALLPLVERVRVLDLGPNDYVVLESSEHLSEDELVELGRQWMETFPGLHRPIVLSGELTVAAVLRARDDQMSDGQIAEALRRHQLRHGTLRGRGW